MSLKVRKTKPSRIFQEVVDQIQANILEGRLSPGDTLPPEMKLKEMFDTSRGTIREALRVLEQKGLVEIRTGAGGGAVVRAMNTDKVTESLDLLIRSQKVSFDHMAEFREGVEGIVAGLAAKRAGSTDIRRLETLLTETRTLLDTEAPDWKEVVRLDEKMHIAIADIAGNPVFTAVLLMVHENILGVSERFALREKEALEQNYNDLCELVNAIKAGDRRKARSLAKSHVKQFNRYMKKHNPA